MSTKTTRIRSENAALDKKIPDVFERLSKQHTNKMNSQRSSKPLSRQTKDPKLAPTSIKKRTSPKEKTNNNGTPVIQKSRTKSKLVYGKGLKETGGLSYQEKALLEKVPETVGKDLAESISQVEESSFPKASSHATSIGSEQNSCLHEDVVTISSAHSFNGISDKENAKEFLCRPLSIDETERMPIKQDVLPVTPNNTANLAKKTQDKSTGKSSFGALIPCDAANSTIEMSPQPLKLKYEDILATSKIEVNDKQRKGSGSHREDIVDDDKDICEADKENEDDFYKVKVQTRLVSYENSTLVIRNTSKQSDSCNSPFGSESQLVGGEDFPLSESLSSLSLQNSSSDHDCSSSPSCAASENASPPSHLEAEADQRRMRGVRTKLGELVTRGKSILSDVRTNYVPDVRTLSNKFQQSVTRRSFRSVMPLPHKECPPPSSSVSTTGSSSEKEPKSDADSGFSSLTSASDQIGPGGVAKPSTASLHAEKDLQMDSNEAEPATLEHRGGEDEDRTPQKADRSSDSEEPVDFSKFFSACPCEGGRVPPIEEGGTSTQPSCGCHPEEGDFPLEIKELLDVDHAR